MSKSVNLKMYDIVLTYTWSNNNHGICGHTFEVVDYYYILKQHFNICIFLAEIEVDEFIALIKHKYDFSKNELADIRNNTIFTYKPVMLICNNIIFTNGNLSVLDYGRIQAKKYILFACGDKSIMDNIRTNTYILQDDRVYNKVNINGINYVKKILLDKLKKPKYEQNKTLIYGTKNCRALSNVQYLNLLEKYNDDFIIITNKENMPNINNTRLQILEIPVQNIFEQFNKYIYTPVPRKFDCSPRFIVECKYFNKQVIYDIDYIADDLGLYWRQYDIEHNFEKLYLNGTDEIINILLNIL